MPVVNDIVTYLELSPAAFTPDRSDRSDVSFSHVDPPLPELNRFFYCAIGGRWFWMDRRHWSLAQWAAHLSNKARTETWVLSRRGVPAGYVELTRRDAGAVEIDYLGLLEPFIGDRLGGILLTRAVGQAIAMGAATVLVNTCTLDHPKALANYLARGFKVVRTEAKQKEIPASPPGPWDGALP
jgi:GNAT superfamily N-acetyltransferase